MCVKVIVKMQWRNSVRTEFLRIRKYIAEMIASNPEGNVRLPSLRVMAKEFGLTAPTVMRAVNDLVAMEMLDRLPGGGVVTRRANSQYFSQSRTVVGMIVGSGMLMYEDDYAFRRKSAIATALLQRHPDHVIAQIALESPSQLKSVLGSGFYNKLLLIGPSHHVFLELQKALQKHSMPVGVFGGQVALGPSVVHDSVKEFQTVLERLTAEGRKRIAVFSWENNPWNAAAEEAVAKFGNAEFRLVKQGDVCPEGADELDAAVFVQHIHGLYDFFRNRRNCRCVTNMYALIWEPEFSGWVMNYDLRSGAKWLADALASGTDAGTVYYKMSLVEWNCQPGKG